MCGSGGMLREALSINMFVQYFLRKSTKLDLPQKEGLVG
jgi:hypothetical protein